MFTFVSRSAFDLAAEKYMNAYRALWIAVQSTTNDPTKITFGEMRASGVREVMINCRDHRCSQHIGDQRRRLARPCPPVRFGAAFRLAGSRQARRRRPAGFRLEGKPPLGADERRPFPGAVMGKRAPGFATPLGPPEVAYSSRHKCPDRG